MAWSGLRLLRQDTGAAGKRVVFSLVDHRTQQFWLPGFSTPGMNHRAPQDRQYLAQRGSRLCCHGTEPPLDREERDLNTWTWPCQGSAPLPGRRTPVRVDATTTRR